MDKKLEELLELYLNERSSAWLEDLHDMRCFEAEKSMIVTSIQRVPKIMIERMQAAENKAVLSDYN